MSGYQEEYDSERGNRWIAAFLAIGLHAGVLFFLLFLVAWREPDPPLPEVGIELNFGTVEEGSGAEQPERSQPEPETQQPVEQQQPVQEVPVSEPVKQVVTQPTENPVSVPEKTVTPKETPKAPVEKPLPKPEEKPVVKPTPKPEEKAKAVYQANPDATKNPKGSEGTDLNKQGDKGDPKGNIKEGSVYQGTSGGGSGGQGGTGTGTGLSLSGWKWDRVPRPKVPENESNGKIVFEIVVDEDGQIARLVTLERGVSLAAEKACKEELMKLKFIPTGQNVPEFSTGKVTIYVNAQ